MILLRRALPVGICLAVSLSAAPALATGVSCKHWNTPKFFERAGAAEVSRCLEAGAEVKERGKEGGTPLHFAAWLSKTPAVVRTLLKAGADIKAQDWDGAMPLHWAAWLSKTPAVVRTLLKADADPKARDRFGRTPLHWAAWSKTPAVVKALLDAGADTTAKDKKGRTPFDYAKENTALKGTDVHRRLSEGRIK